MAKPTKLELTWLGKQSRPRLEPRILIEDATKSSHASFRVSGQDLFDNRLVFGDNLLALKALEQEFLGRVKCVYIDPPFNTGAAFENYEDGIEHSLWLSLMAYRLELLHALLRPDGVLFVHLDDNELDYCKVLLDEVFGRGNFINRITIEARSPSAFSTVNPGVFKATEYLLWYAKDRQLFRERAVRVKRQPDYAYNKWLQNPDDNHQKWRFVTVMEAYSSAEQPRARRPDSLLEHFNAFIVRHASQVCRLAAISDTGAGQIIVSKKRESESKPGKILRVDRGDGMEPVFITDGQQIIFYDKNVAHIDGEISATRPLTNVWSDIPWEGIANEGGVTFRKGKKPERLLRRCIDLATDPGDWVLDSFAGSGTTGAVAHKMGRRWIMVELGEHCHTHIIPRLKKVIDGKDSGGITEAVGWEGGGGFRYYRLAPSLLEKDQYGNWVINRKYNAAMLAEAICKLEGFAYAPSDTVYWQHGHSTEGDFIYVTTQTLTRAQVQKLSDEVGEARSLLILCGAFRVKSLDAFPNLTVKKIPKAVLSRCEWGEDDYSLEIRSLPMKPAEDDLEAQTSPFGTKPRTKAERREQAQATLFDLPGEEGEK